MRSAVGRCHVECQCVCSESCDGVEISVCVCVMVDVGDKIYNI